MKKPSMSNKQTSQNRKLSQVRRADPEFARESANYEFPLPSREYILQTLAEQGVPTSFDRLCQLLDIADFEREPFLRRLGATRVTLERDAVSTFGGGSYWYASARDAARLGFDACGIARAARRLSHGFAEIEKGNFAVREKIGRAHV